MTMEERLEKLECELARTKRGNRSMLAVMAVMAVMAVALVWMATRATPDAFGRVSKVIRANEFWLGWRKSQYSLPCLVSQSRRTSIWVGVTR